MPIAGSLSPLDTCTVLSLAWLALLAGSPMWWCLGREGCFRLGAWGVAATHVISPSCVPCLIWAFPTHDLFGYPSLGFGGVALSLVVSQAWAPPSSGVLLKGAHHRGELQSACWCASGSVPCLELCRDCLGHLNLSSKHSVCAPGHPAAGPGSQHRGLCKAKGALLGGAWLGRHVCWQCT